jgi:hypothetical protein
MDRFYKFSRRSFLADMGMGVTGLALGSLLQRDGVARANPPFERGGEGGWSPPDGRPHFPPRAKTVIWLFMVGGASQMETFDPKPELNRWGGKTFQESPYAHVLTSSHLRNNLREVIPGLHQVHQQILPMQIGYRRRGESGIGVTDWWPHLSECVDDIAFVRSMWTTDNNHGAQLQFFTGRHSLEGAFPTVGSWIHYGLGTLNENLPQFVVLGTPLADCCAGVNGHGGHYLGPAHNGVRMNVDPNNPLPFASPGPDRFREEQRAEFDLLGQLNRLSGVEYPDDPVLRARIRSYELAFRMQTAVPEIMQLNRETEETRRLYGLDNGTTAPFGQLCLAARRLAESGVRFIQIFHGSNGGAGAWDAHGNLRAGHSGLCAQTDKPVAALVKDLKRRGMLDDVMVVWGTEFGRTPGAQGGNGRDHHPYGFTCWLAGGGIKGGVTHGATDELGFHAVENRHYVTDLHATVLHQMGLDPRRLDIPGRRRLEIDYGHVIREILA